MSDDSPTVEQRKAARIHVLQCFERLSLPTSGKVLSKFSREDLLYVAIHFMAPVEMVSKLEELSDVQLCWHVKKNFFHNRNTAVTVFLNGGNALSLSSTQALLSWKDLTSVNVSQGTDSGDGVHDRSTPNSSLGVGSETTSELASSPEVQQLLRDMQTLRSELKVLKEERSLAPDEDEDRSAGGRRLELLPTVREMLPADPVREELTKPVLASILRLYPLPSGYILKAGELSVDEKSRLSPLVAEEISKLGKIINRYTDVARPLIALLNVLQGDSEGGGDLVSIDMVRGVVLHSLQLLFHHQSKIETERHLVHFKDEKVLQSVFQKPVKKTFFNENERSKLQTVAEDYKRLRKIRENLTGKPKKTINKKSQPTLRPTSELRPSPPVFAPGNRGDYNKGKNRLSTKPGGKGRQGKGGKTGEARGSAASAQDE